MEQRSQEWHEERLKGIGGSEAAAAMGISRYQTPNELYLAKTDPTYVRKPPGLWADVGIELEPWLARQYEAKTGREFVKAPAMIWHPNYDFVFASLDGKTSDRQRIVEFKTTNNDTDWGEPGSDEIPIEHLSQVQQQMAVSGAHVCDVLVMFRAWCKVELYAVERNDEVIEGMIEAESEFWKRVVNRTPPPITNASDAMQRWGRISRQERIAASKDDLNLLEMHKRYDQEIEELKSKLDAVKAQIMQSFADRGDVMVDEEGKVVCSWKMVKGAKVAFERKAGRRLHVK